MARTNSTVAAILTPSEGKNKVCGASEFTCEKANSFDAEMIELLDSQIPRYDITA